MKDRWASWEAAGLDDLLDEGETRTGFLLRFTNAHPGMNTNIVGTMNVDHLKENIAAACRPLQQIPTPRPKAGWTTCRPIGE